jgi:hypothetical protein
MNYVLLVLIAVLISIPLSNATENPTMTIRTSWADVDYFYLNITISNPSQNNITLRGLEYSISDSNGIESLAQETPVLLEQNKSFTYSSKHFITNGDPLMRLYRKGSANYTVSGSLFFENDSTHFVVPFLKTVTYSIETEGAKWAISPNITDIKIKISRLRDEKGMVKMIITTTNISIYNPNPVGVYAELDFDVIAMHKKDEQLRIWKILGIFSSPFQSPFRNNPIIMPMNTYVYSTEQTISDNDTIQYFTSEEPKYIKVEGSAFLIPNEAGWSPAYFEPAFNTLITITNGSTVGGEVASTPTTPTPTSTIIPLTTPKKNVPGFKVVVTVISLLILSFFLKKRS